MELMSSTSRVQAPVVIMEIGGFKFGLYSKRTGVNAEVFGKFYKTTEVQYPNYMKSLEVRKINGTLNTYVIKLQYQITEKDDPNLIDKILSSVSRSRKIKLSYGDAMSPSYMYREEEALLTDVKEDVSAANSCITYTLNAVSTAINLAAGNYNFPAYNSMKPSTLIYKLLQDKSKGLQDVFYGMHDIQYVRQSGVIAGDDCAVKIEAKSGITVLDYLRYLVDCMTPTNDIGNNSLNTSGRYALTIHDGVNGDAFDGPYFTVAKISSSTITDKALTHYTLDVGYPGKDYVTGFTIDNDMAYSILYDYSQKINQSDLVYRVADNGRIEEVNSIAVARSKTLLKTTQADKNWWSKVTQYPIKATVTLRGLLRAATLMSYVQVNVWFYGRKHNASGLYIITEQNDTIDDNGFMTALSLLRIRGDDL
jgi:hypothetical protein